MGLHALPAAIAVLALAACAGGTRALRSDSPVPSPRGDGGADVWITGSSNIRHFTCRAGSASLRMSPGAYGRHFSLPAARVALESGVLPDSAALRVAVASLDCGMAKMNEDLRRTLEADDSPVIEFRLLGHSSEWLGDSAAVRLDGVLRVAGRERPIVVAARAAYDDAGRLVLHGRREIDVTDFGVRPPSRFFGLLRVRRHVTVHFVVPLSEG